MKRATAGLCANSGLLFGLGQQPRHSQTSQLGAGLTGRGAQKAGEDSEEAPGQLEARTKASGAPPDNCNPPRERVVIYRDIQARPCMC